jgi:uncharacterized protein YwqG
MSTKITPLEEWKTIATEWKKFSDLRDDMWGTTMANDKRVMQMDFRVWYLQWVNESLKRMIKELNPKIDLSDENFKSPEAKEMNRNAKGNLKTNFHKMAGRKI